MNSCLQIRCIPFYFIFANDTDAKQLMKYIAFILSIYICYLVSAPCVDEPFRAGNQWRPVAHQCPDSQSDHADACSPFCICSCCSIPVTVAPGMFISQPYYSFQRSIFPELTVFHSFFNVAFWQPPKLS